MKQEKIHQGENAEQLAAHEFDMLTRLKDDACAPLPISHLANTLRVEQPDGECLAAWATRSTPHPTLSDKLRAAIAIAVSLAKIHAKGIVYRNISPNHVLINAELYATWTNFERATRLSRLKQSATQPSQLKGELAYYSPELTGRINRVVDWRSDLYGLGVLFYELFAGRLPFAAESPIEWVNAHLSQLPAPIDHADLPPNLIQIIMTLLAKNPEQRYASVPGLIHDLERLAKGERNFPLHERDFSQSFALPDKLYGRDAELAVLEGKLSEIHLPLQTVTISAPSGMGKTALVEELKRHISIKEALLCSGKFDQYQQGEPYSALAQAIDDLARQVLRWDTQHYEAWRKRLLRSLNGYGRILTDLSPMLERILGEQPKLPEVDAELSAVRSADTFFAFFQQCASADFPVIFFIDDLQWVDSATLSVLSMLKDRGDGLRNVLMIHAYRSNELVSGSPYEKWLREVPHTGIFLEPLPEDAVTELMRDGFHNRISHDDLQQLAHTLAVRSGGSPFNLRTLIANLIETEAIRLDTTAARWSFDAGAVAKAEVSADVAQLLLNQIKLLPEETYHALSLMSFIGRDFRLNDVMLCADIKTASDAAQLLWPAVEADLITPLDEGFQLLLVSLTINADITCRFVHDKVQAASQEAISDSARDGVRRQIAFRLLQGRNPLELGREALLLADLVTGLELADEEGDTRRLLQLRAGSLLRKSGQITRAKEHLEAALAVPDAWSHDRKDVSAQVITELSEVHRANADIDGLIALDAQVDQHIEDKLSAAPVCIALVQTYCSNQRMDEALARTFKFLDDIGHTYRRSTNPLHLLISYSRSKRQLGDPQESIAKIGLGDARAGAVQAILMASGTAFLSAGADLMPLIISDQMSYSLSHGTSEEGIAFVATFAIVAKAFGDQVLAQDICKAMTTRAAEFGPRASAMVHMVFNVVLVPTVKAVLSPAWIAHSMQHAEALLRYGDVEISAGIINGLRIIAANSGQSLATLRSLCREDYSRYHLPGVNYLVRQHDYFQAAVNYSLTPANVELDFPPRCVIADNGSKADTYNTFACWKTLLGQPIAPEDHEARRSIESSVVGQPSMDRFGAIYEIYCARYGAVRLPTLKGRIIERVKRVLAWASIKKLHKLGYEPFVPLAELVFGCRAERRGRQDKALRHYRLAYDAAVQSGSLREQIFAAEYSYRLLRERNREAALVWLQRALVAADEYSFMPKTVALKEEFAEDIKELHALFPQLKQSSNSDHKASDDLDLATLIQAGADLAEAKDLKALVDKALEIVVKNLSATRAQLWQPGTPWTRLGGEGEISEAFLDEVYRAQEIRVIDDASETELSCQSALCIPMASGGQAVGLLVIENDTLTEAFPRSRLPFLRTLSNQIATAIANALLYAQMEEKVQEKARAMVAIMTHIEQGIFTIEASGKIADDYSSALPQILGLTQIAGRDAMEILFQQAELATDVVDQVGATLFASLGEDVLNFEVNAERLISEFSLRSGKIIEVDWVPIVDDFEEVRSIMVTLRDVTQVRASQAAAEASAMELKRIGSLLALSPRQVSDFFNDARTRLEASKARVEQSTDPSDWLELNFRDLHTLKGVSRSYQFLDLAAMIHEVEDNAVDFRLYPAPSTRWYCCIYMDLQGP